MKMTLYYSTKIKIINFILILMVLYIHGFYIEGESYSGALMLQRLLGTNGIMSVAVRLFFSISGFLFFRNITSISGCYPKIRKRIRTLVVPYILWNVIFVFWYVILEMLPFATNFVNSKIWCNFNNVYDGLYFLFIRPANFPLWFLRDLIMFVIVSPIIYIVIRYLKIYSLLLSIVVTYFLPFVDFYYFVIGGYVALCSSFENIEKVLNRTVFLLCCLIYLSMSISVALQPMVFTDYNYLVQVITGVSSLVVIWRGYDYIVQGRLSEENRFIKTFCGYSFFVFLFHEPVYNIIKKVPVKVLGDSEIIIIILFMINPFIMYLVAVGVAKILKYTIPKCYSILVGGR